MGISFEMIIAFVWTHATNPGFWRQGSVAPPDAQEETVIAYDVGTARGLFVG